MVYWTQFQTSPSLEWFASAATTSRRDRCGDVGPRRRRKYEEQLILLKNNWMSHEEDVGLLEFYCVFRVSAGAAASFFRPTELETESADPSAMSPSLRRLTEPNPKSTLMRIKINLHWSIRVRCISWMQFVSCFLKREAACVRLQVPRDGSDRTCERSTRGAQEKKRRSVLKNLNLLCEISASTQFTPLLLRRLQSICSLPDLSRRARAVEPIARSVRSPEASKRS